MHSEDRRPSSASSSLLLTCTSLDERGRCRVYSPAPNESAGWCTLSTKGKWRRATEPFSAPRAEVGCCAPRGAGATHRKRSTDVKGLHELSQPIAAAFCRNLSGLAFHRQQRSE